MDPRNPNVPEIIIDSADGYHLDSNWRPVNIEYVYKWWGLGDPVFDNQVISYQDGKYLKNQAEVPVDYVNDLLKSIDHLYPSQFLLSGVSHADDYPSWTVEMKGEDGRSLWFFSTSTSNPGDAPWNILYNGRLYAQFDGSIGDSLMALFPGPRGEPRAAFYPGGGTAGKVYFSTSGWPSQITEGFTGLLPIADGFHYFADAATGEIKGSILGRSSIGGMGMMVIGKIDQVSQIHIFTEAGELHPCDVKFEEKADPAAALWSFSCKVGNVTSGDFYNYPLEVTFNTEAGTQICTQGVLDGVWQASTDALFMPLPEVIENAFLKNKSMRDLLTDHIPVSVTYSAEIDPKYPQFGTYSGEVVLLGETQVQARTLRYSIASPFAISGGLLSPWKLSREHLNQMLDDITQLELTKKVLDTSPQSQLNMWYAEKGTMPKIGSLLDSGMQDYVLEGAACGDIPAWSVPDDHRPMEAFGFNNGWNFWMTDFVLLDGKPYVNDMDLSPYEDDRKGLLPLLIPKQLDTGDIPPFARIWLQAKDFFHDYPVLTLWIPDGVSSEDLAVYNKIADTLPVKTGDRTDTWWEADNVILTFQDDGTLVIKACSNP